MHAYACVCGRVCLHACVPTSVGRRIVTPHLRKDKGQLRVKGGLDARGCARHLRHAFVLVPESGGGLRVRIITGEEEGLSQCVSLRGQRDHSYGDLACMRA